ncbi:MAG: acetyl-CoA C-acetyltransferase, partial [Pseudomonadota bacterium]
DGLEDAYAPGTLMGAFAEDCAGKYRFTREEQDEYALASLSRSLKAAQILEAEIAPIELRRKSGLTTINSDEQPRTARPDKIAMLKPAFSKTGTVTAANASCNVASSIGAAIIKAASDTPPIREPAGIRLCAIRHTPQTTTRRPTLRKRIPRPQAD